MIRTTDRKRKRRNPVNLNGPERVYRTHLRKIAKHVEDLFDGFPLGDLETIPTIEHLLRRYAEALTPWAEVTAARMLDDLNRRDEQAWMQIAQEMSRALRDELRRAPTGETMRALMAEQVGLIRSIPLEAAERVHRLTIEALEDGTRAAAISKEIQRSGEVAKSRADLIARTEVSRAATSSPRLAHSPSAARTTSGAPAETATSGRDTARWRARSARGPSRPTLTRTAES